MSPKTSFINWSGDILTALLVNAAVLVKKSPIPDAIGIVVDTSLETYYRIDDGIHLNQKIAEALHVLVSNGVLATGIIAAAAIKAGVAYQQTPGFKDEQHAGIFKIVYRNQWIRSSGIPGSYPSPDSVDHSTQTDFEQVKHSDSIIRRTFSAVGNLIKCNASRQYLPGKESTDSNLSDASTITSNDRRFVCSICTCTTLLSDENQEPVAAVEEMKTPFRTEKLIHLNVGGVHYATTLETLTSIPKSHLYKMFESLEFQEDEFDEIEIGVNNDFSFPENILLPPAVTGGSLLIAMVPHSSYIGALFHHVLNHLRDPCISHESLPNSRPALWALICEAKYYNLEGLQAQCHRKILLLETRDEFVSPVIRSIVAWITGVIWGLRCLKDLKKNGPQYLLGLQGELLYWVLLVSVTLFVLKLLFIGV